MNQDSATAEPMDSLRTQSWRSRDCLLRDEADLIMASVAEEHDAAWNAPSPATSP